MAKLTFKYGVMGSSKSLRLLIQKHDLEAQGKVVVTCKGRNKKLERDFNKIKSRIPGMECMVTYSFCDTFFKDRCERQIDYWLIDEAQFLSPEAIKHIRKYCDIPVVFYGLKTDFQGELFPGSATLLAICDEIEEIPTICKKCLNKAMFNMRIDKDGKKVTEGPQVDVGGDEKYIGVCADCYYA